MKLHPMLMFKGNASAALEHYTNAIPAAKVTDKRTREDGTIESANLLFGQNQLLMIDSPIDQPFDFTPSFSLFVFFEDQVSLDLAYERLSKEGQVMMNLGAYDFAKRYGWVSDKFGVSWQLCQPRHDS
ncbi:VOC family protein [Maritalea mediterranea]|uniref:VOC family protein n=1 Tax=Maritalea mediterranea TaxID=2909667 RepID=A0ABS9E7S0_9HYPH|nr:VOC family protein [Maritalea mediterranea]MCF4097815.1 VOC family protein [Maritalea mediterranea]